MLGLYHYITGKTLWPINWLLKRRLARGKEDAQRLSERKGLASLAKPSGPLVWVHGASVGEAQSALILINQLLTAHPRLSVLVTTGTVTSARYLKARLPERAFHQYYPIDYPNWTERFLEHWAPDAIFWMESELWPNMLTGIKRRNIKAALINARLSRKIFLFWRFFRGSAKALLSTFSLVIAQTPLDEARFKTLGALNAVSSDNIKYSAKPLPCDERDLKILKTAMSNRSVWVFASTHAGEETMACRVHQVLKNTLPDILTILIPRHPERGHDIEKIGNQHHLKTLRRTAENKFLPQDDTDLYIADTLGELGLFYRLSSIACIGRSFSDDGGGGHNPIEAAQLYTCILHGPKVQFQQMIFDDMHAADAALQLNNETQLTDCLLRLFQNPDDLKKLQEKSYLFAKHKEGAINRIMEMLEPFTHHLRAL